MRIHGIDVRELRWPLEARGAARGADRERVAVIVVVRGDNDVIGLGEAAPLPRVSIDHTDDALTAARELAGRLPVELHTAAQASALADRVTAAPAARFAIETALLAALAQHEHTSIARLLAHMPHAELQLAVVVDDAGEAQRAAAAGARCLKLKVGGEPGADIARVRAIAQAAPTCRLRLDANRGWPAEDVDRILHELRDLPLEYVEEPCREAHELLACDLPYRIALDESLVELDRAQLARALASPRLAALVLKPTLLGGLARCLELARVAHRHGVAPVVTHALEGPIGTAACAELALAVGADVPVGLAPHPALVHFAESI
jgi:o-succinylbenzoate synthase